jgi:serine/threonine-protein kinase SRPK3
LFDDKLAFVTITNNPPLNLSLSPRPTLPSESLMDDFVYTPDELAVNVEDLLRYKIGGYHPVILGDVIRSPTDASYRILHKLGHGTFSTVWLADHDRSDITPTYVAMKISTADGESANEANLLRSVPSRYIIPVVDAFELAGPNGRHHVIVTEVLLPFVSFTGFQASQPS